MRQERNQAPPLHEHGFERIRGVPGPLPEGERLLWQGAPDTGSLAIHAFHVRKVALYLLLLIGLNAFAAWQQSGSVAHVANTAMMPLLMTAFCLSLLVALAWMSARNTVYSLTSKRLILRIGMALPVTINLPFELIHAAHLGQHHDGRGDLAIELVHGERIAYLMLWPNARPWRWRHPQPSLRCIADPQAVAAMLKDAVLNNAANGGTGDAGARQQPARQTVRVAKKTELSAA